MTPGRSAHDEAHAHEAHAGEAHAEDVHADEAHAEDAYAGDVHAPHADVHTAARVGPPAELQVDVYVDVYVDVLCPWCFIAKRRLAAAVAAMPDVRVSVVWRSFELGPTLGREPGPTAAEEMAGWWGDQADARIAMIRRLGAAEGLELNLDRARPVNSFDAHRLLHLAAASGRADRMLEGLLRAYHIDGADIADHAVLERLGVEAGVTAGDVAALLASDAYADAVRADEKRAAERGVTGVPALVIGTRPPVSAVQSPAHLVRLLKTV